MKKGLKAILATLFVGGFLFSLSSCSGNKYYDGKICGKATADGDNTFSQIRRYYVEQYVYELNEPTETMKTADDGAKYDIYDEKYLLNSEGNALVKAEEESDSYFDAHYIFYYYSGDTKDLVTSYVNSYAASSESFTETDATNYLTIINTCANDGNKGYFSKVSNMDLDNETSKNAAGNEVKSVSSRLQAHSKACIVFVDNFRDSETGILIPKTKWTDAWNNGGLLMFILVYPMAALISLFVNLFGGSGVAQMFAILIVTLIIKVLIFLSTFKSQASTQKMQDIQPEIAKIQVKYGQTPTPEQRQQMSMELMSVYKKYGVKPFAPFVSLLITFPVFISMYRAVIYLAVLRTGTVLGVTMGNTVNSYIIGENRFNFFALILFLIMAATQVLSMKMNDILNRKRLTPEQKKQQGQMKMMTNVMMIMILVMGFMMPITMSIYWISSAIVTILQTVLMHKFNNANKKGGRYKLKKKDDEPIDIPQGYRTK